MSLIEGLIKSAKLAKQGKKVAVESKPFFSAVDKAALDLQRAKGTGKEFMTELKKTKGIKPAEIESRKLAQIEEMPKMTKDQFIDELEKRPPAEVSERTLIEETEANKDRLAGDQYGVSFNNLRPSEEEAILSQLVKYGDYKLPGGKNYREILLQLPTFGGKDLEDLMYLEAMERRGGIGTQYGVDRLAMLRKKRDEMGQPYMTPHFEDEPNTLAHMRVQDRIGPNGEKILHVEEIQSDWHQTGREKGYKEKYEPKIKQVTGRTMSVADLINEYGDEGRRWLDTQNSINADLQLPPFNESTPVNVLYHDGKPQIVSDASKRPLNEMVESHQKAVDKMQSEALMMHTENQKNKVPDAPFKKNWHELAMKRLINYASENGYDSIAITPGAEQADRYNLANHIDSLNFSKNSNGTVDINGIKDRSTVVDKTMQTPEQVESLVGKEIARKIFDTTTSFGSLTGLDLKVGGEGMKGFYDKMIPDYLNTFGKKYGVQTEMGGYKLKGDPSMRGDASERLGLAGQRFDQMTPEEIEAFNANLDESNAKQLHYFKITPEMREEVKQGMPLYQQIGVPIGTGAAGAEFEMPQPQQEREEPAFAAGGAVFDTTPDMSDGGKIIQGSAFKRGGKVHVAKNFDTMFMELNDKKFKRK